MRVAPFRRQGKVGGHARREQATGVLRRPVADEGRVVDDSRAKVITGAVAGLNRHVGLPLLRGRQTEDGQREVALRPDVG